MSENEVGEFRCIACCEMLPRTAFSKDKREKNGIRARCKKCLSIADKNYMNSPKGRETRAIYRRSPKGKELRALCEKTENGRERRARQQKWPKVREIKARHAKTEKGKETASRYFKSEKGKETVARHNKQEKVRIARRLRSRLRCALKRAVDGVLPQKSNKTLVLLGCSIEYFKKHIEQQFKPGMTWERFGEFHIDHIKPCAAFDLRDPEQQQMCFHYSNMQPLWPIENLKKGAKF